MVNISCVEYTTAIICASLPHLKALASTILPGLLDSAVRSLRDKRQSLHLTIASSKLASDKSTSTARASRISSVQPATLQAFGPSARTSTYGHTSFVLAGDKKTRFQLVSSNSEEYMLEPVPPGEIHVWKETEVGVQERDAGSTSPRRADRHSVGPRWPL